MGDLKSVLERGLRGFEPSDDAFERTLRDATVAPKPAHRGRCSRDHGLRGSGLGGDGRWVIDRSPTSVVPQAGTGADGTSGDRTGCDRTPCTLRS
jgi:hypothetical protein